MGGPSLVTPGINCSTARRCVRGSTLAKYFLAKVSFTTATGRPPATSCSVMARPFSIWIPKVLKKSGVTIVKPAPGRDEGSLTACPARLNGMPKFVPMMGMPVDAGSRDSRKGADLVQEQAIERVYL